jgi:hypothetical protein
MKQIAHFEMYIGDAFERTSKAADWFVNYLK